MSRLTYAKKWEQSHLPSKEQLKLHVDEEAKELNILAEYEHKRWSLHKKEAGWKYGKLKDESSYLASSFLIILIFTIILVCLIK